MSLFYSAGLGAAAIPDSVVSRPDDNNSASTTQKWGVRFSSSVEWPKIGARLSANFSGATTAYIYRADNDALVESVDISSKSPGETIVFDVAGTTIGTSTDYDLVYDAGGSSYTSGYYSNTSYPYTSPDGNLSITTGVDVTDNQTFSNAHGFVEIGDVGL